MSTPHRERLTYLPLVAVTVVLGLGSRHFSHSLPPLLAKNLGDALYATLVFWLVRLLRPGLPTLPTALLATFFCFLVEFSQLYQASWITHIRHTRLGGRALGHGFHATDLMCYVAGVGLAVGVEALGRGGYKKGGKRESHV